MPLRTRIQIAITLCAATAALTLAGGVGTQHWLLFCLFLAAVLLSSGFKIALPGGEGSMTLNLPFLLLGIVQLSPLGAMLLAGSSVAAQCRFRVNRTFPAVQLGFSVANTVLAMACALLTYAGLHRLHLGTGPSLVLASVAYLLWSTTSNALMLASAQGESASLLWRKDFPPYVPFYLVGAVLAALADWMSVRFGWSLALLLIPSLFALYRVYTAQISHIKERQGHLEEIEALHLRTIEGLAMAIEAKDQGTHDHLFRVRHYVKSVGQALQLTPLELQALEAAALLHDIGKLAVPEHIINKPGKLTPEEFEKMKIHPVVGADILERVRFPYPVVPIVRSHHEWWNGTGYPDGLRGTDIPLGARILSVIDCFDALVSDRPYRKGLAEPQAMNMLRSLSGKQFDPTVVEAFERCRAEERQRLGHTAPSGFSALNTDVEVWRGLAPGAGFEAGSDENAPSKAQGHPRPAPEPGAVPKEDIATADLVAAASQQAQEFFEMSQALGDTLTAEETLSVIALRLRHLIPFDVFGLYLKRGDTLELSFQDGHPTRRFTPEPIKLGEGIAGWVARSGRPLLNGNAAVEPGCPLTAEGAPALRSGLSIPLLDLHRDVFAVLTLYSAANDSFSRGHLRTLLAMESKLALAVQNVRKGERVATDLNTDFLTGLPNARRLFLQLEADLQRAEDHATPLTVLVCDLNSFREINERRGHLAANRLLRLVADGLRQMAAGSEMIARVGGDEFAWILPHLSDGEVEGRCAAIRQALASAARRTGQGEHLTASVGTASFPGDGSLAEDLLAAANRRMYIEKQQFYSSNTALSVRRATVAPFVCNR